MIIRRIVLVVPADPGSKGDEGMIRGAINLLNEYPIIIVNHSLGASWLKHLCLEPELAQCISEVAGPLSSFLEHLKDGDLLFVVGADVIDGTCGARFAKERIDLIATALSRGLPVYTTCSFRSKVADEILQEFEFLPGIRFLMRDEHSLENLRLQTGNNARLFPDLSFFLDLDEPSSIAGNLAQYLAEMRGVFAPIIGLNFAEHSFRSFYNVHSDDHRREFVASVLNNLISAYPSAYFVLMSNDTRVWPNHFSDDDFATIAEEWIVRHLGKDRVIAVDRNAKYADNIAVLRLLDFVVTGRMHLSYAAFRAGIVPLVLMGQGLDYSSIDKMCGAFELHLGTSEAVITQIDDIARICEHFYKCRSDMAIMLAKMDRDRAAECAVAIKMLRHEIAATNTPALDTLQATVAFARLVSMRQRLREQEAALKETEHRLASLQEELARQNVEGLLALKAIVGAGNDLADELLRTYARPWRPFKRAVKRALLRLLLIAGLAFSDQRRERMQHSRTKLLPTAMVQRWNKAVADALSNYSSTLDTFNRIRRPANNWRRMLIYRFLNLLADLTKPFSEHRARRFRRSAAKRAPHNFRQLNEISDVSVDSRRHPVPVADSSRARRILVADSRLPRPDVSAGERATVGLLADLVAVGYEVVFIPMDMVDHSASRLLLEKLGVTVVTSSEGYKHEAAYIEAEGHNFGAFYFIRINVAEALLPTARAKAKDARIIFHSPDLHSLREIRAASLNGDGAKMKKPQKTQERELAIMRASDHVVLVSPAEVSYVEQFIPHELISVFPALYSPMAENPLSFAMRKHIYFLGGFGHDANAPAVKWFVKEIWPRVHAALPDAEFHIIGAEAPSDIVRLGDRPGVRFVGFVADLEQVLEHYRVSVIPLLYGAGIKGKVGMAMGAGIPTVTTIIGAEGMGIIDGIHALVRDDAAEFAEAVVALYRDEVLWSNIACNGQKLVAENFGYLANRASFMRLLENSGVLPLDIYVAHCKSVAPLPLPLLEADSTISIDVSIIIAAHCDWAQTKACLNSVALACLGVNLSCEVILVCDHSTDGAVEAAEIFPGLRVMSQKPNQGLLPNYNLAAAEARGRMLLFIDDSAVVMPNWLSALVGTMAGNPDAAIVGSKLLYPDGRIQQAGGALFSGGAICNLGSGQPQDAPLWAYDREVDCVSGTSTLVQQAFWNTVGGFDERYVSSDCGLADLAMSARARGLRVVYSARSVVVNFECASFEELPLADHAHMTIDGVKLLDKWRVQLAADCLADDAPESVMAAHAERSPTLKAVARRRSGRLNILYFSPFPSHPDCHGNQATIQSFGRKFQKMGHRVHFVLLESNMYDNEALAAMRAAWDTCDLLPNSRPLWADGSDIPYDGWYQPGLGENIRLLCQKYDIDLVFCSYVFQSRLLEYVPAHIVKVVDTHDKMGNRYEMLRANGQPIEFFSCTPEEEGAYLRRADVVTARRAEEARYFNEVSGRNSAIVLPHVEEARFLERNSIKLHKVGVVASANRINLIILHDFLSEIAQRCGDECPFTVEVAGQVKAMIPDLLPQQRAVFARPWVSMQGFVPDIGTFYRDLDLIVSPVTMGTGINVKTVQAMAFGMPLLTTRVGIKGIETDEPLHNHETLTELVDSLLALPEKLDELDRLAEISVNRYKSFLRAADDTIIEMFGHPKITNCVQSDLFSFE